MHKPPTPHPMNLTRERQHYRQFLRDLVDMGSDLAHELHAQAMAKPRHADAEPLEDAVIVFTAVASAVRRAIILVHHLEEHPPCEPGPDRVTSRDVLIAAVDAEIARTPTDPAAYHAEILEQLDGPDQEVAVTRRPIAEAIAAICRDFGIAAPRATGAWRSQPRRDVEHLCARAANGFTYPRPSLDPPTEDEP